MLRTHPVTAFLLVLGIVGTLVFGSAATASAAIWPKGFNPKQYMLNVLSSMLAQANPDSKLGAVKRAVIQEDQKFDHSWESLNELWKKDATKVPSTYQDYVLQRQEYFNEKGIKGIQGQKGDATNTGKGTKYVKPMKAPATKAKTLIRKGLGVGIGVGAGTAWMYRAELGSAVGGLFGMDTDSAYCSDRDQFGNLASATDLITGIDCDAWAVDQAYDPNLDAVAREAGWKNYPIPWGCSNNDDLATCYQVFTVKPQPKPITGEQTFTVTAGTKKGQGVFINYFCLPATGKAQGFASDKQLLWYQSSSDTEDKQTATIDCKDGSKLYAWGLEPTNYATGSDPDGWLARDDRHRFWYSELSPNFIAGSTGDPDRTFLCTYTMEDGSTVEKETDTFKETDSDVPSPVCPAVDPEGPAVKGVSVDEVNKDDGSKQNVYKDDTTEAYSKWWGAYPECREGACALDLLSNKHAGKSCFYDAGMAESCVDWMKDPDKTKNYQCMYGGHKVDLTECYAYGDVFNPEKVLAGQAYTDPATGETVEGQSSPNAAQKTLGRTFTDPQDFRGCLDTGWAAANPVEWVMTPVQCALQWAFAPSTQVVTTTTNKVQNQWASKAPGKIANAVSSWSISAPGGCDIPVTVMGTKIDLSPACPGQPLAGLATLSKIATTAMVAVIVFFASRRVVRSWIGDTDSSDGGSER